MPIPPLTEIAIVFCWLAEIVFDLTEILLDFLTYANTSTSFVACGNPVIWIVWPPVDPIVTVPVPVTTVPPCIIIQSPVLSNTSPESPVSVMELLEGVPVNFLITVKSTIAISLGLL